jgi:hypothetical protein
VNYPLVTRESFIKASRRLHINDEFVLEHRRSDRVKIDGVALMNAESKFLGWIKEEAKSETLKAFIKTWQSYFS